jgi:hypothetical protein
MSKKQTPLNYKDPEAPMTMEDATTYLKKLGEWEGVWHLDRDTIIKWAEFLKKKGETK